MLPRMYKKDADIRKSQINTLKVFNANVSEITEGQEYQIPFNSGANELILNILLGSDFPKDKPLLRITPVVVHPWVNSEGEIVSAPGLLNFTVHSDLGRVVQAITREFERTPPPLASAQGSSAIPILDGEVKTNHKNFPTLPVIKSFSPPSHNLNMLHTHFPQLNNLSLEELQFVNENVDRQQELIEQLPYMVDQTKVLDNFVLQIEELAESNLSKQEQLENLQKSLQLKIDDVTQLVVETERLHGTYQSLSDKYAPRNIQDQLKVAASNAEEDSEKIVEKFLNGDLDVDRFVNQFIQARKLCQLRKTKEEKLGHQLDSLEKAGF